MQVLIIEDEINAFNYLQTILKKLVPQIHILGHLESVEDAVNWLVQNEAPDLIFLDIQLSDGLSFEIFKHVELKSPIIFTTAFDQYAIEAFKVNSIDYLLKPIHIDDLRRSIQKYEQQQLQLNENLSEQIRTIFGQLNEQKKHRFLVRKGNHFEFINVSDIACINSDDGLTFLHTFQNKRHHYTNTIERLIKQLDVRSFFQINRSQIVNIEAIQKIHPYFNQRLKIELRLPTEFDLVVSRSKVNTFKQWVDQ